MFGRGFYKKVTIVVLIVVILLGIIGTLRARKIYVASNTGTTVVTEHRDDNTGSWLALGWLLGSSHRSYHYSSPRVIHRTTIVHRRTVVHYYKARKYSPSFEHSYHSSYHSSYSHSSFHSSVR